MDYSNRTAAISPSLLRTVRSVRIYQDYQEVKAPSYINNQQGGAPSYMRDSPHYRYICHQHRVNQRNLANGSWGTGAPVAKLAESPPHCSYNVLRSKLVLCICRGREIDILMYIYIYIYVQYSGIRTICLRKLSGNTVPNQVQLRQGHVLRFIVMLLPFKGAPFSDEPNPGRTFAQKFIWV